MIDLALELGSLALAPRGAARRLDLPDATARISRIGHPFVDLVAGARFGDDADARIDAICAHYPGPMGWMVGPHSTPADLGERLVRTGFVVGHRALGLVLDDLDTPLAPTPGVRVRRAEPADRAIYSRIKAESFGIPLAAASAIDDLLWGAHELTAWVAEVDGEPIGFGQAFRFQEVVILGGGGVLPAHRGKGAFRALVAARIAEGRASGATACTIQAMDTTSAPICARMGFREHTRLTLYVRNA